MTSIALMTRFAQCKNSKNCNEIQKLSIYTEKFVSYTENVEKSIVRYYYKGGMEMAHAIAVKKAKAPRKSFKVIFQHNWQLWTLMIPGALIFIIFRYLPMTGIQIAFKNFNAIGGIWGSPWVGFEHFVRFFTSSECWLILGNTLKISVLGLVLGFPLPIMIALLLNQTRNLKVKKVVQTTIYAPYFISVVVVSGMIMLFLSPSSGVINKIIEFFGGDAQMFMASPEAFPWIYVISDIWQNAGYNSIVYIAALAAVGPELHESAVVDGATTWQRIRFIDFPCILPTAVILLIINSGRVLTIGFEKIYLLQNTLNRTGSEVLSTYVYKVAFGKLSGIPDFSYGTAIGLFESVISLIIILAVNKISSKVSETSLF